MIQSFVFFHCGDFKKIHLKITKQLLLNDDTNAFHVKDTGCSFQITHGVFHPKEK